MGYYNQNRNIRNRLKEFCRNNLTKEQAQSLFTLFMDNKELFSRLCQAYNEYKVSVGREYGDMNFLVAFDLSNTPYGYRWGGGSYFGRNIFGAVEKYKDKTNTIADSSYW